MRWEELEPALAKLGVALDGEALPRLRAFRDLVLAKNRELNLTRIVEEGEVVEKHVLDSLAVLAVLAEDRAASAGPSFVDVGSGAGFPGIAIAIARPLARVLLVESARKKARFLEDAARALGLANVTVLAARAEEASRGPPHREAFDRATVRAVGSAPLALEYALPFLKIGGRALLHRGPSDEDGEAAATARASALLGGGDVAVFPYSLPESGPRRILVVPKTGPTPERFPRRAGAAAKRPLD